MPVLSAPGEFGTPLFIFKDKIPYRNVLRNGILVHVQKLSSSLRINSTLARRSELGGVDSVNFMSCAHSFVQHTKSLNENSYKCL